jgi:hypothetical protein
MFRENKQTTSQIIELIQTLPDKEQKIIVSRISGASKKEKTKKTSQSEDKGQIKKIKAFQKYVEKHRFATPGGFK